MEFKFEDLNLMVNEVNEEGKLKRAEMFESKKEIVVKKIDSVRAKFLIVYMVLYECEFLDLKKELNLLKKIVV